jgi:Electron transfer flavoprotein, beta subunit
VDKGNYDLILTGAQSDTGAAQTGAMLAAMLDRPFASLVNLVEVQDDSTLKNCLKFQVIMKLPSI